jgi:hypothetical protein
LTIDRLIRIDKFEFEYIKSVIRWCVKDTFWSKQVRSLASLRNKSKNGLTKFQNMATSYDSKHIITGNKQLDNKIKDKVISKKTAKNIETMKNIDLK